jgi:DNA (cytosine-5)-methyltransferase 1
MENVPPILKSQEFAEICSEAKRLGYRIEGRVLNAADYGASQTRKRAIIIGSRIGSPVFPQPTHYDPSNGRETLFREMKLWRTVRDAIGDLPLEPTEKDWHISRNPTSMSVKRYKCIPEGGNRWDLQRKRPDLTPGCWIRKKSGGTDLFGRLWWNRPAFTIRTEFFKPEKGRYLHPQAHRPITHREAARLQGFPDDFVFVGSRISVAMQIGNAVPPPLAEAVARSVLAEIRKKSYAFS